MKWSIVFLLLLLLLGLLGFGAYWYIQKNYRECPLCPLDFVEPIRPKKVTWERFNENQDLLRENGKIIGAWDYPSKTFTEGDGHHWGRSGLACPVAPPVKVNALPTGLVDGMIHQGPEEVKINGQVATKEEALAVFDGPCPNCPKPAIQPNKSGKPYVTVVSSLPQERQRIKREWYSSPTFAEYKDILSLWEVEPGHWSLDPGFQCKDGTILLQRGDGAVLHRQETLDTGLLLEALRIARPEYDFRKDPKLGGWGLSVPEWIWGGLACVVVSILFLGFLLGAIFFKGGK